MQETMDTLEKLNAEIDVVPWSALARHFAFGRVYQVHSPYRLADIAHAMHHDQVELFKDIKTQNKFIPPREEDVKLWHEKNASFQVLVISPFVLIQKI